MLPMLDLDEFLALCDGNANYAADALEFHTAGIIAHGNFSPAIIAYLDAHAYTDSTLDDLLDLR